MAMGGGLGDGRRMSGPPKPTYARSFYKRRACRGSSGEQLTRKSPRSVGNAPERRPGGATTTTLTVLPIARCSAANDRVAMGWTTPAAAPRLPIDHEPVG